MKANAPKGQCAALYLREAQNQPLQNDLVLDRPQRKLFSRTHLGFQPPTYLRYFFMTVLLVVGASLRRNILSSKKSIYCKEKTSWPCHRSGGGLATLLLINRRHPRGGFQPKGSRRNCPLRRTISGV